MASSRDFHFASFISAGDARLRPLVSFWITFRIFWACLRWQLVSRRHNIAAAGKSHFQTLATSEAASAAGSEAMGTEAWSWPEDGAVEKRESSSVSCR